MKAAAIYARISDDRYGTGAGVSRQVEDCKKYADRHGWTVAEVYVDNDISAYSGKPRPAYRRMCEDLKDGTRDGVVVWHSDRLHRQPLEMEHFIQLMEATGARVATVTGSDYDLTTSDGRAMARVVAAFSRKESEDKSRRIKRKHAELATNGARSGGGTRGYGYTPAHDEIVTAEAQVIREAARRALAGESIRAIAIDLNNRAIPTVTGVAWSTTVLRNLLCSARLSGQREHHGEIVAQAAWPPILSPAETTLLRAKITHPDRRRTGRTPRRYPLNGLLRCQLCGSPLVSRPRGDGRRRYICAKGPGLPGCGKIAVLSEDVENLIVEAVLYRLDTPELHAAIHSQLIDDDDAAAAQQELAAAQDRLNEFADLFASGEITRAEYLHGRKAVEAQIDAAQRKLAATAHHFAVADYLGNPTALSNQWAELSASRQRAVVAAVIDHADVGPAVKGRNTFDPSRIHPVWRA